MAKLQKSDVGDETPRKKSNSSRVGPTGESSKRGLHERISGVSTIKRERESSAKSRIEGVALPGLRDRSVEATPVKPSMMLGAWYSSHASSVSRAQLRVPGALQALVKSQRETVFLDDDREPIRDTSAFPYRAMCYLETNFNGHWYSGTGWLASPRLIITAGHVVYDPDRACWAENIDVYLGGKTGGQSLSVSTSALRSTSGWVNSKAEESDYAAILLDRPFSPNPGYLGFGVLDDSELNSSKVNVTGFPVDKSNGGTEMWGSVRFLTGVNPTQIFYDISTAGGDSGCPVIIWEPGSHAFYSVGIHNYGGTSANYATRITQEVYDNILAWRSEVGG